MRTPASLKADAAPGGVRLSLPLAAGPLPGEVTLEPAHCERLFRIAAFVALRDGRVRATELAAARLVPGRVRDRHGDVSCLESCAVELVDRHARLATRVEFPRAAFAPFAAARAIHLLGESGSDGSHPSSLPSIRWALHATPAAEDLFPVTLPVLPRMSVARLAAEAARHGAPDDEWIATFLTPACLAGLDAIERESRAAGVEAAARVDARVGFDASRRCFVRILDRVVISRATRASATAVVSTAASWADFLDGAGDGPRTFSSLHTHLHLDAASGSDSVISVEDVITHMTRFTDPLAAAVILSLFHSGRELALYGHAPDGGLREEPGHWTLPA